MQELPKSCPQCGSKAIARIQYGLPIFDDQLERELQAGKVVLGGCDVGDEDPAWQCITCGCEGGNINDPT